MLRYTYILWNGWIELFNICIISHIYGIFLWWEHLIFTFLVVFKYTIHLINCSHPAGWNLLSEILCTLNNIFSISLVPTSANCHFTLYFYVESTYKWDHVLIFLCLQTLNDCYKAMCISLTSSIGGSLSFPLPSLDTPLSTRTKSYFPLNGQDSTMLKNVLGI